MATVQTAPSILEELADLFASNPPRDRVLKFHPSKEIQKRARDLLARQGEARLTDAEQHELDEFLHAEMFMRLVKAKLHAQTMARS
jgi:DnaJ-domain-containing protein 1